MSSTRQTVTRGLSLTGLGNRPDLTPAHHVDLPTGMTSKIFESLTKPSLGKAPFVSSVIATYSHVESVCHCFLAIGMTLPILGASALSKESTADRFDSSRACV